jgi:hypothetical protein
MAMHSMRGKLASRLLNHRTAGTGRLAVVEIPLSLSSPSPDRLVYGIPRWYRAAMALVLAALAAALALGDGRAGAAAWTILGLVALGGLYDERWSFDAGRGEVQHRVGLCFAAKASVLRFGAIERFRLVPLVAGTVPGSEAERAGNAAALAGQRADDGGGRRFRHRRPFLDLVLECADGRRYVIDRRPARGAGRLRGAADRIAAVCGKPLVLG